MTSIPVVDNHPFFLEGLCLYLKIKGHSPYECGCVQATLQIASLHPPVTAITYILIPKNPHETLAFYHPQHHGITGLVQRFEATTQISVIFIFPPQFEKGYSSFSIRLSPYRVVQQDLDNIKEHAEASAVTMYLQIENQTLNLLIKDNEKGFESDTRQQARQDGHLGLLSMESRVNSLGGVSCPLHYGSRNNPLYHNTFNSSPKGNN